MLNPETTAIFSDPNRNGIEDACNSSGLRAFFLFERFIADIAFTKRINYYFCEPHHVKIPFLRVLPAGGGRYARERGLEYK
jgi:hypothetical protein